MISDSFHLFGHIDSFIALEYNFCSGKTKLLTDFRKKTGIPSELGFVELFGQSTLFKTISEIILTLFRDNSDEGLL